MLGVHYYLFFCLTEKVIERGEYRRLLERSWTAIVKLLKAQDTLLQRYSTDGVVGRAFSHLLENGKYHLRAVGTDDLPKGVPADRVGWLDGEPQGKLLGYVDAAAQRVYVPTTTDTLQLYDALPLDAQRLLGRGPKLFWKGMTDNGLVTPEESGRNSTKIPKLGPERYYVLSIPGLFS